MEKRYQVFVSSTFLDLQEERQEVMQALLELDCMPSGMELFPATNDDQWSLIKQVIDDSDYYIVVLAGRYGSISSSGLSYTEMEYRYALETGKPIIGFIHNSVENLPAKYSEANVEGKEKLENFRRLVQKKLCKFWSSPADLGSQVSRSLMKLIKSHPAIGWVRANLVPTESAAQEMLALRRRIEELEQEIESAGATEPKSATNLAKGDDEFRISYEFLAGTTAWDNKSYEASSDISWNDIFSAISPIMINEASDIELKNALDQVCLECAKEDYENDADLKDMELHSCTISEDDFHTIKIQLRALGLITQSIRNRRAQDSMTYWTLTPYGDTLMTMLRAIERPSLAVESESPV
ncbi:DUF4062 domain-containing protein [Pseudomonas shirazica]|uniref:DUF4062 domain-containing protein n=1 Tax=Pseudomonas shirazica TaxID=1940636 RepID=UPI00111BB968|nr:DUF4062 domain-containing protein [Pseudomonas shirazica]